MYKVIKRILDVIFSFAFIVFFSPILLAISLLIVSYDGLPFIYTQQRTGKMGRPFKIYKFRTMVKNADKIGPLSTTIDDIRITKVGKVLRKFSLDELPQFFNVLLGDMSLVGNRPTAYIEKYTPDKSILQFRCKPGLTGLAQVNGRSTITCEKKRYYEQYYDDNISFILDLKIVFLTIKTIFIDYKNSF